MEKSIDGSSTDQRRNHDRQGQRSEQQHRRRKRRTVLPPLSEQVAQVDVSEVLLVLHQNAL
ncbi:hypothetical protein [Pseudorhodoferax soli]|uniref:hypothetical protein n=1 Tax=Pseudorhodoferax soli TaxID=545864 RepID=UPI0011C01F66|nr:hypothetical protein [Pseudorhodoferax soli]